MAPRVNEEPFGAGSTTGMTRFHTDHYVERLFNHARRWTTNHPPNRTIVSRYRAIDPVGGSLYAPKYFPLIAATIKPPTHKSELLFICHPPFFLKVQSDFDYQKFLHYLSKKSIARRVICKHITKTL